MADDGHKMEDKFDGVTISVCSQIEGNKKMCKKVLPLPSTASYLAYLNCTIHLEYKKVVMNNDRTFLR